EETITPYLAPTEYEGLQLMTTGPLPPNPAELIGSSKMSWLLEALAARFDIVVIDSSPVLAVADPVLLSSRADATVLVVNAQRTRVRHLQSARKELQAAGAKILGV